MSEPSSFFHLQNLQEDFLKYYASSHKHRIDEVRLSRLGILFGAAILHRRIEYIFQKEETKGIVICAHLKHSKIHDFYIIAACLIYGYTIFHSNWHLDNEETLAYKIKVTNCRLVIIDDDIDTSQMVPDVKYLRLSDLYTQTIYSKGLSLCNSLTLVESMGKEKSDSRVQDMLSSQSKLLGSIKKDAVMMITFTSGVISDKPKARKVTYGDMAGHFQELEDMGAWTHDDVLVVFMTNPTYDYFTSVVLYYCLRRRNVHVHFLQRYMSTYWKILWEANEHAKNVYQQLGKSYKILSFLFPRQLEALLTLEEVARECQTLDNAQEPEELSALLTKIRESRSDIINGENEYSCPLITHSDDPDSQFMEEAILDNTEPGDQGEEPIESETNSTDRVSNADSNKGESSSASQIGSGRSQMVSGLSVPSNPDPSNHSSSDIASSANRCWSAQCSSRTVQPNNYVPKLHVKFAELRNVLCDINVVFLLSGTFASMDLCRTFSNLTGGKTPYIRYTCSEVSHAITYIPPTMDRSTMFKLYDMGLQNSFKGRKAPGHYIGIQASSDVKIKVVKSIDPCDMDFIVECSPGEPGNIVCSIADRSKLIIPGNLRQLVLEDGTYLGIEDVGFYIDFEDKRHYYWVYKVDSTLSSDGDYPYIELLQTSRIVHLAICKRYGLAYPVVRVETIKLRSPDSEDRIVCAIELITSMKGEINQDIRDSLLDICKSVGIFNKCLEPDELRVLSIPWAYKGTVNYAVLRDILLHK